MVARTTIQMFPSSKLFQHHKTLPGIKDLCNTQAKPCEKVENRKNNMKNAALSFLLIIGAASIMQAGDLYRIEMSWNNNSALHCCPKQS
jgi:hypothetical protein